MGPVVELCLAYTEAFTPSIQRMTTSNVRAVQRSHDKGVSNAPNDKLSACQSVQPRGIVLDEVVTNTNNTWAVIKELPHLFVVSANNDLSRHYIFCTHTPNDCRKETVSLNVYRPVTLIISQIFYCLSPVNLLCSFKGVAVGLVVRHLTFTEGTTVLP